ncbi:MAG: DEAD/DEAH box helicase, partial [Desulfovibrionaceae bacterium]|nr:DEAD/DEAH box helicase [Desulfovibrionaceae bacterium]
MISDSEDKGGPDPRGADQGAPLFPETSAQELPEHLRRALDRAGWKELAPVQALSIPTILAGQDLMVQARTGSGKTGAFILPILHKIDPGRAQCQALVLTPTRELARQVAGEAETLFGDTGARVIAVYGGVAYGPQEEAFRQGAHLVVGTPGRILDHLLKRNLSLEGLRMLVFDEADRMLSIGFYPDMKEVQRYLPGRKVDSFMFSATFPPQVLRLAEEFLTEPKFLSLSGKTVHVAESEHVFYEVPAMGKER